MKHSIILITLLAIILPLRAQNLAYEKLDAYSNVISSYQLDGNNLSYDEGNTKYEISFAETNFKLTFYNQFATQAVYKKANGREILYLTENIDLSKVKGITSDNLSNDLVVIKLHLKSGATVNTQLIEDGKVIRTESSERVELFCKDNAYRSGFISKLFDVCFAIQHAKGLISKKEMDEQKRIGAYRQKRS